MAGPWYVNPGLGSGGNTGADWANAFSNAASAMTDAITASSAGDDFYINSASTLTNTTSQTWTFKGTAASPNRVFSCSTITNQPPVTADLGTGAVITNTGTVAQNITGFVYIYGLVFNNSTGSSTVNFNLCNNVSSDITLDSCQINIPSTGTDSVVVSGTQGQHTRVTLINTPIKFSGGTASTISLNAATFIWKNTANAIPTGSQAAIANLFTLASNFPSTLICDSVDFNGQVGIASGKNIVGASPNGSIVQLINCKTTTNTQVARPTGPSTIIDQIITDSGATGYYQQRDMYQGTLSLNAKPPTIYNNATDGTTPISWQVVTTANAKPQAPFKCFDIVQWVAAGTYAASKVFVTSASTLVTNDVWVDVQYLGSNYALGSAATSFGAGVAGSTLPQIPGGTTPAALTAASPAWATGGLGHDYQLTIPSFVVSAPGYVRFSVKVGKATLTVNIDPAVTVA